jgi:hypothetical protein
MFPQAAYAITVDAAFGEMNFGADNGAIQSAKVGENAGLGFTHRYDDVISGVDAIATVIAIQNVDHDDDQSNGPDNLTDEFDDSSSSGKELDMYIDIFGDSSANPTGEVGFLTFRIDFVAADTNNALIVQNVGVLVADIDSNQYVQFAGISAYELSGTPATELTVTSSGGAYEFKEPIGSDADNSDQENWVLVEYSAASSITISVGSRESGTAYFGVKFIDAIWTLPANRVTPPLTAYTLTYDGNSATSGSAPSVQSSTGSSSSVTIAAPQGSLIKTNCTFGGWNTASDGTGANYLDTDSIAMTANATLYANWSCVTPPTTPTTTTTTPTTLAATGADLQWLPLGSLIAVVAGAGFLTFSRRKRTQ